MKRTRLLLPVLGALLLLAACASAPPASSGPPSSRVRCLTDPNETGTRPLFFLFCVQSP